MRACKHQEITDMTFTIAKRTEAERGREDKRMRVATWRLSSLAAGQRRWSMRGLVAMGMLAVGLQASPAFAQFSCNTVYAINGTGQIYSTTNTGAQSQVADVGGAPNPFGISSNGNFAYVATTAGVVRRYNAVTNTVLTPSSGTPTLQSGMTGFLGGAVNPVNGLFYIAGSNTGTASATSWYLYVYDPASPSGAPALVAQITGIQGNNGDITFDSVGNLYVLSGNVDPPASGNRIYRAGQVTTGAATLPATEIATVTSGASGNVGGIAFNAAGELMTSGQGPAIRRINPLTGAQIATATPSQNATSDLASCAGGNTITLQKDLPQGRFATGNQFTLQLFSTGLSPTPTATTTGATAGIQAATVGPLLAIDGASFTINEAISGSTNLANYSRSWQCVDAANSNAPVASGSTFPGTVSIPSTGNGSSVVCTITNAILSISGTVFQDTLGELLADGTMGSTANPALSGRTVRLFNSAGTQQSTRTTAANGSYSFNVSTAGDYYVAVDAPTINAAGNASSILLEQTYAVAGTGNTGAAGGTGYGPLCVGPQPGYTQQGATTTSNTASNNSNGACYGGRRGAIGDTGTNTLNSKEHVTRVVLGTTNITGVDFGFSPYVATNVEASGQGSLLQFSRNYANADAGGTYSLRVVPTVPTNASGGGGNWWNVDIPSLDVSDNVLSGVFSRVVHFNGTPNSNTNGTTSLDPNPGDMVAASTALGNQGRTLGSIPRPDFAVRYSGPAATTGVVISIITGSAGSSVRNFGIRTSSDIANLITASAGQVTIERNVLGRGPDGGSSAGIATGVLSNHVAYNGPVLIQSNFMGGVRNGIEFRNQAPGTAEGYLIQANYMTDLTGNGVSLAGDRAMVRGNYITLGTIGITDQTPAAGNTGSNTLTENTTTANGRNMHLIRPAETVTFNTITNASGAATSAGAGVTVETGSGIRISQNTFGGNNSNAIDLNRNGVTIATATGGNCPSSGTANASLPRPSITSARLVGGTLTLNGFYCNAGTHTLEFYKAGSGAGDTGSDSLVAGEGVQYLGSLTAQTGGAFTNQTLTTNALVAGDLITVISIRADGSTSEFSANVVLSTAQLTLRKTWAGATVNDAVTITLTGTPTPTGGAALEAVANTASETDTSTAPYGVLAGQTYTITEAFTTGAAGGYTRALACTGNDGAGAAFNYTANALSGTVTIGSTATAVICTFTNTRMLGLLEIVKTGAPATVPTGELVTYTITVTNPATGPQVLNAVLRDTPPAGLDCAAAGLAIPVCTSVNGGAVCPAAPLAAATLLPAGTGLTLPDLPSGSSLSVTLQCRVTASGQ